MRFNKYKSKLLSIVLLASTFLTVVQPLNVQAIDFSSNLNTPAALGSPLLNESTWSTSDWNKWETVGFGVFLSNFPVPLVDDYASVFQAKSSTGSKGRGLEALKYGSGNDSQANKVLENLIGYAITDQSQQLANIKVRYHKIDGNLRDSLTGEIQDDGVDSKLKDMFIGIGAGDDTTPHIVKGTKTKNINQVLASVNKIGIDYVTEMVLPEFYITVNGKPIVVFDFRDGYDLQMFSLGLARAANSDLGDEVISNLSAMKDSPIGLDVYGNICVQYNGRNVIVVPASANQYLTKEKQYNLLTSNFLIGSYLKKTGDSLVNAIGTYRVHWLVDRLEFTSGDTLAKNADDSSDLGKVIMYSDTDVALYQYLKSKVDDNNTLESVVSEYINDSSGFDLGTEVYNLVNSSITDDRFGIPFKVDVIGAEGSMGSADSFFRGVKNANSAESEEIKQAVVASSLLANIYPTKTSANVLNYMFTLSGKANIFSDGDKQYYAAGSTYKTAEDDVFTRYANYALKYIDSSYVKSISGTSNYGVPTQEEMISRVRGSKNFNDLAQAIYSGVSPVNGGDLEDDMPLNGLFKHWLVNESGYKKGKKFSADAVVNMKARDIFTDDFFSNLGSLVTGQYQIHDMQDSFYRVATIYGFNSSAITASNVLNVVEGTEFASYTPYIYLSYLDFYGIVDNKSNFNDELFKGDLMARTGEDIAKGAVIDPETKKELMESYMFSLLDPDSGSEYRQNLVNNFFTEFLYDNYRKITVGSSDKYISESLNTQNEGFLAVNTVSENMFIGGLVRAYTKNFLIIFGILLLISFVLAIFSNKGIIKIVGITFSFAFAMALSPAIADVVPMISNRFVQGLFSDSMTYWSIAESIENDKIDVEALSNSDADAKELNSFIRMLNLVQYNKTILIKNDISKKVVENISDMDVNNLQRLRTARWLLPVIVRQFSAVDGSADYASVTLSDTYRNIHNLYWLYRESRTGGDKIQNDLTVSDNYDSVLANDVGVGILDGIGNSADILSLSDKQSIFGGYQNTRGDRNILDYRAINRFNNQDDENLHTSFYLMNFGTRFTVPNPGDFSEISADIADKGLNKDTWDKYSKYLITNKDGLGFMGNLVSITDNDIIPTLGSYNSYNDPIYNYYGYLWMTENPLPYFYINLKDTFNPDMSIGKIVYELQGYYADIVDDSGATVVNKAHHTFMRDSRNGGVRDFMDMEEFFTNVLPYLYNVQIIAGGDGSNNGAFGSSLIGDEYSIYKNNNKSWLFRSNWVTKIQEGELYNQKSRIGYIDGSGNKAFADIYGSLHPSSYAKYRPMIFSEAQMLELGLVESDLSYTESKILKLNKKVEKKWLSMINYSNTKDMKADILYKQMALDAMMEFNKEFSVSNIQESKTLYPYTLDIRNVSFDSVMKLMYMGATKNTSVLHEDTMKNIITNGDIFSGICLLVNAIICSKLIPMVRDFSLGFVTLLLLFKVILDVVSGGNSRNKYMLGSLFIYLKSCVLVIAYYLVFRFIISSSQPSTVISTSISNGSYHNVWWYNIIILVTSVAYVAAVYWTVIRFTWIHRRDMGLEASLSGLSNITSAVTSGFSNLTGKFGDLFGISSTKGGKARSSSGSSRASNRDAVDSYYYSTKDDKDNADSGKRKEFRSSNSDSYYRNEQSKIDRGTVDDINSSIDRGSSNIKDYKSRGGGK